MQSRGRRTIILIFLLCFIVNGQTASPDNVRTLPPSEQRNNLEKFTNDLRRAFLDRNFEVLADRIYKTKEFTAELNDTDEDRKEKGIIILKQIFEEKEKDGMKFKVTLKSPQKIIRIRNRLFAVVPQQTVIVVAKDNDLRGKNGESVKPGRYNAKGFILAISENQGETWKYWSAFSEASFEMLFPETIGKIKYPEIKMPSFMNNQQ